MTEKKQSKKAEDQESTGPGTERNAEAERRRDLVTGEEVPTDDVVLEEVPPEENPAFTESTLRQSDAGIVDDADREAAENTEDPGPNEAVLAKEEADAEKAEEARAEAKRRNEEDDEKRAAEDS